MPMHDAAQAPACELEGGRVREPPPLPSPGTSPSVPIENSGTRLAQEVLLAFALIMIVVLILVVLA